MQNVAVLSEVTMYTLVRQNSLYAWAVFYSLTMFTNTTHAFDGDWGFTAVFAFSTQTGKHGWGFNLNPEAAGQRALAECGQGAQLVAYQKDGYLALVWDGRAYAYGHSKDSAQEAYDNAVISFQDTHDSSPRGKKVVSSDGRVMGFN